MSGRIGRALYVQARIAAAPRVWNYRYGVSSGPGFYGPRNRAGRNPVGLRGGVTGVRRPSAYKQSSFTRRVKQTVAAARRVPTDNSTQEVRFLMPKPPVIVGRPETYVGPLRVPKPQQGESGCRNRSYFKMKGLGVSYAEGSDVLYRSGASNVWRTQHGLYAVSFSLV